MKNIIFTILCFISVSAVAQDTSIGNRLTALKQSKRTFYNIDGYTITSQEYNAALNEKGLKRPLKDYDVKFADLSRDNALPLPHYYITKTTFVGDGLTQYVSHYFVEKDQKIIALYLASVNKQDKQLEHEMIQMIVNNRVPAESFQSMTINEINFGGRKLKLGGDCYWTNINTVQCPYEGEMNWSVHRDSLDAKLAVSSQMQVTKSRKNIKVLSENAIDIIFEDVPVKATKVVYDLTGLTSIAAGMSGGKTLTVYYVAAPVRGNYISCVLSHWNNDNIGPGGLPLLLEQVMRLK